MISSELRRAFIAMAALSAASFAVVWSLPAHACDVRCGLEQASRIDQHHHRRHRRDIAIDANGNPAGTVIIGGRPSGCPHAFCGCGLRKYLGLADARLNLAWNWARLFPHTVAHVGAAAVRHHHVMLLVRHLSGRNWIVRDYNSGNGLSRIHARNVSGYVFVDPYRRSAER